MGFRTDFCPARPSLPPSLTCVRQAFIVSLQPGPLHRCCDSVRNDRWVSHGRRVVAHAHFSATSHAVFFAPCHFSTALARAVSFFIEFLLAETCATFCSHQLLNMRPIHCV